MNYLSNLGARVGLGGNPQAHRNQQGQGGGKTAIITM
jgi:hypothetical protein